MRMLLFLSVLALPLASCGVTHVASASQISAATADQSYITAVSFGMQRVAAGKMTVAEFTRLETAAYTALLLVRSGVNVAGSLQQLDGAAAQLKGDQ